jgi:hypothetical protein
MTAERMADARADAARGARRWCAGGCAAGAGLRTGVRGVRPARRHAGFPSAGDRRTLPDAHAGAHRCRPRPARRWTRGPSARYFRASRPPASAGTPHASTNAMNAVAHRTARRGLPPALALPARRESRAPLVPEVLLAARRATVFADDDEPIAPLDVVVVSRAYGAPGPRPGLLVDVYG